MFRKLFVLSFLVVFAVSLAGCATSGALKQKDMEIQGLKNQITVLEAQVQSKDQELVSLKETMSNSIEQPKMETTEPARKNPAVTAAAKERPSVRDLQGALKNAGFDPGKIDGQMGKQTREAIKAFQKAHNLKVNGKANKKTWALLSAYLNQK